MLQLRSHPILTHDFETTINFIVLIDFDILISFLLQFNLWLLWCCSWKFFLKKSSCLPHHTTTDKYSNMLQLKVFFWKNQAVCLTTPQLIGIPFFFFFFFPSISAFSLKLCHCSTNMNIWQMLCRQIFTHKRKHLSMLVKKWTNSNTIDKKITKNEIKWCFQNYFLLTIWHLSKNLHKTFTFYLS